MNLKLLSILFSFLMAIPTSASEKIKIAFIAGLTGADPNTARELVRGVEAFKSTLTPKDLSRIDITVLDNAGSVEKTAQVMRETYESGVRLFVGLSNSNEAIAAAKFIATKPDALFITPFATNVKVTQFSDRVFRTCFDDDAQGRFLARYVAHSLRAKKVFVLTNLESLYSQGLSEVFKSHINLPNNEKSSAVKLKSINYIGSNIDNETFAAEVTAFQPDVVFIPDSAQMSAKVVKQIVAQLPNAHYVGGDGWGGNTLFHAILPKSAQLSLSYSTYWHSGVKNAYNDYFKNSYKRVVPDSNPTSGAALTFESLEILNKALIATKYKLDVELLKKHIGKSSFPGTTGLLKFKNGKGTPDRKIVIMKLDKDLNYKPQVID